MNDDAEVIAALRRLELPAGAPSFTYVHLISVHQVGRRYARYNLWEGKAPGADGGPCCSARQFVVNRYHHGIRQADAMIEELFAILEAKGLLGDALVAITADHGERLGDDGGAVGHGGPPIDGNVRVPLLIYDAQGFAYPPRRFASVVDIAPTLLERIGAPVPEHWSGLSLAQPERERFVMTQSRQELAVIGAFGGALYKYYHRPGDKPGRLVRLGRPGGEEAVPGGDGAPPLLAELRSALGAQARASSARGTRPSAP